MITLSVIDNQFIDYHQITHRQSIKFRTTLGLRGDCEIATAAKAVAEQRSDDRIPHDSDDTVRVVTLNDSVPASRQHRHGKPGVADEAMQSCFALMQGDTPA
jgi:hypothetical protein